MAAVVRQRPACKVLARVGTDKVTNKVNDKEADKKDDKEAGQQSSGPGWLKHNTTGWPQEAKTQHNRQVLWVGHPPTRVGHPPEQEPTHKSSKVEFSPTVKLGDFKRNWENMRRRSQARNQSPA